MADEDERPRRGSSSTRAPIADENDKPTEPSLPAASRCEPIAGTRGELAAHRTFTESLMGFGRAGYEGYARSTGGKTFDGREMPIWDDLTPRIKIAWTDAAIAILALQAAP